MKLWLTLGLRVMFCTFLSHSVWSAISTPSFSIWSSLAMRGLGVFFLSSSFSWYAKEGWSLALRNLGLFCSNMNVFQTLVLNIALQLSKISSDYANCALFSRMQETCVFNNQVWMTNFFENKFWIRQDNWSLLAKEL